MKLFFDDPEFDQQFARTVGKAAVGMADVGDCFATANRMTAGNYRSWRDCWHATAERVEGIADQAATPVGGAAPVRGTCGRPSTTGRATSSTAWTCKGPSYARRGRRPGAASGRGSTTSVSMSRT